MYFLISGVVGFLIFGFITVFLVAQLSKSGMRWINDEEGVFTPICGTERVIKWLCKNTDPPGEGLGKAYFLMYLFGSFIAFLWVVGIPGILVIGGLFGLRGFIRLKKKVNAVCDLIPGVNAKAESAGTKTK